MNKRVLGKEQWISNDDLTSGFNNNDLIVGGSGSGKTGGYVIPNLLEDNGSTIVTDTKSQLYRLLGSIKQEQGYIIRVLDFVNPEESIAYNPLDYIRYTETKDGSRIYKEKDIVSLAHVLVPCVQSQDPFWQDSARTVVSFLIAFALEALDPKEHSMHSIVELYRVLENERNVLESWLDINPNSFAAKKYKMFKAILDVDRTWGCIQQFVAEALEPFDFKEMDHIFSNNHNKFQFKELWQNKTILFLNVSDNDRYADQLVNLFYSQAIQVLCQQADQLEKGRLPRSVRMILDDFASNVYIEDFDKLISVIRSRNLSVSVILQSLTQLESMYSKSQANTIVTNCDHILYLGGQDIETAQYIGYRANKTEESILLMPFGKAYLIERGQKAKLVDRVQPYEDLNQRTVQSIDLEIFEEDETLPF